MEPVESSERHTKINLQIGNHANIFAMNPQHSLNHPFPPPPQSINCPKSSSSLASSSNLELRLNETLSYSETYSLLSLPVPTAAHIATLIASLLDQIVARNTTDNLSQSDNSTFHSKTIPGISIAKYLQRLAGYSRCSPETFIMALIYVDRFISSQHAQTLGPRNVHKLYLVALVCAAKFNDDLKLAQWAFAKLGGLAKKDLCLLEAQFLRAIEFRVVVSSVDYRSYLKSLVDFAD